MRKIVDIIIVNWNSAESTLRALAPYVNYTSSEIFCNTIIVDNASSDDSLNLLNNVGYDIIINKENVGFSKACNQALRECNGDYILLLNPDTISDPNVLEELVHFMENNQEYGIAGPAQFEKSGTLLRSCARFPSFTTALYEITGLSKIFPRLFTPSPQMTDWDHLQSKNVDHVMGSYMLIRKSILGKVGFMDEDYFMYMEDLDFSKRVASFGYQTFYNTTCKIIHEHGTSGDKIKAKRLFYSLSSRGTYWKKHLGKMKFLILTSVCLITEPSLRMIDSIITEKKTNFKIIVSAYFLYIKKLTRK